jgi:hypothetical protein
VAVAERAAFSLGAEGSASDLFGGRWLFGAGVFADVQAPRAFALPRASLRGMLHGALRPASNGDVKVWLAAGRVEGCPFGWELGRLDLRPCAALDAGAMGASWAGVSDAAFWLAAAAHARGSLSLGSVALEARVGALLPLTRYAVTAADSGQTLEDTRIIGFSCGLGARVRFE